MFRLPTAEIRTKSHGVNCTTAVVPAELSLPRLARLLSEYGAAFLELRAPGGGGVVVCQVVCKMQDLLMWKTPPGWHGASTPRAAHDASLIRG